MSATIKKRDGTKIGIDNLATTSHNAGNSTDNATEIASSNGATSSPNARTTIVLPLSVDENLEAYALRSGIAKGEIIKRVIVDFLIREGMQPDRRPKVEISY